MLQMGVEKDSGVLAGWKAGVEDFNQGRYWHAHAGLEVGWIRLPFPMKDYVQSLIMACAVFVHLEKSRAGPARTLCKRSLELFATSRSVVHDRPRVEVQGLEELLRSTITGDLDSLELLERAKKLKATLLV